MNGSLQIISGGVIIALGVLLLIVSPILTKKWYQKRQGR